MSVCPEDYWGVLNVCLRFFFMPTAEGFFSNLMTRFVSSELASIVAKYNRVDKMNEIVEGFSNRSGEAAFSYTLTTS